LIGTAAAARGDTQVYSEIIEIVYTSDCCLADLLVGDAFADADIHTTTGLKYAS